MSNSLAIATVTAALQKLLTHAVSGDPELGGTTVTAQALDKARGSNNANQLNVFLYQITVNPALRNMEPPQLAQRAMPLNLHYLITAYGQNNDDIFTHRLLGRVIGLLHDHPLLGAAEIKDALPDNDLFEQVERVRFTWQTLSLEDTSKLWAGFQGQYRLSVAYEAAVVLIDSALPIPTPLPVLTRGPSDRGVSSQTDVIPPFPALTAVEFPHSQPSARPGDQLTIRGHHLDGPTVLVRFTPRLPAAPQDVQAEAGATAETLTVTLPDMTVPDVATKWVAGFYTVAVVIRRADQPDETTNELPLPLAPLLTAITPKTATPNASRTVKLTVTCRPEVRPEQRVLLLLGDRAVPADAHPAPTGSLTFTITAAPAGTFIVRLRVDGVDSLPFDPAVTPPQFDAAQQVTIK